MASTVNQKVGVYIDKANTAYTVSASYKDAMKVAQSVFWSSAKATETPVDNFVVTGGGISSLFYLGLPDPTSITLPTGLKTLTEDGTAIPMTENQFSFDVSEAVSNGAVATGTTFTPTMALIPDSKKSIRVPRYLSTSVSISRWYRSYPATDSLQRLSMTSRFSCCWNTLAGGEPARMRPFEMGNP